MRRSNWYRSRASGLDKPPVVAIDVDFDGTLSRDGLVVSQDVLRQKLAAEARAATPANLMIRPNRLASYNYVASVMSSARNAGVRGIGIIALEQFL